MVNEEEDTEKVENDGVSPKFLFNIYKKPQTIGLVSFNVKNYYTKYSKLSFGMFSYLLQYNKYLLGKGIHLNFWKKIRYIIGY